MSMLIPITDDRYFTGGTKSEILEKITLYEADEYDHNYAFITTLMPAIFSVNLRDEIIEFTTKAPPQFEIPVDQVIELACYYYCDWDSVVAVTDDFLRSEVVKKVERGLVQTHYDVKAADEIMQEMIIMLSEALTRFIGVIIGVLSRAGAPAIMDFGCCYRLHNIDNYGNVYFGLRNPSSVHAELEGDKEAQEQHCTPS